MAFKHILIATDFGECAARATAVGLELATRFNARVTLVHSWEVPTYSYAVDLYLPGDLATPIEKAARTALASALATLQLKWPNAKAMLRAGGAWEEIIAAATETRADLIVLGTHGRRGISHALLGSVAERVVRMATLPVLTVHAGADQKHVA